MKKLGRVGIHQYPLTLHGHSLIVFFYESSKQVYTKLMTNTRLWSYGTVDSTANKCKKKTKETFLGIQSISERQNLFQDFL